MKITGAEAMVKCLENEGVSVVFGYPGATICPFYDRLSHSPIRHVLVRHEQNAGHAASGYARISGKVGVCAATSGPGALNLITALATAYMDSIPLVAITGQVQSDLLGRDVFQEADITGAAEPFTKHSFLIKDVTELPRIFKEAFYIASTGRPGPVLIDIPIDIQQAEFDFSYPAGVSIRGYKPSTKGHVVQMKRVVDAITHSERPVICAGGGVIAAGAKRELREYAEKCGIPVVSTMMGIGVLPSGHPLYLGMLGTYGTSAANLAIGEADLLIIIGARVGDRAVATPGMLSQRTQVIHIDIDPAEIGKNMGTAIPLVGDAKQILTQLYDMTPGTDFSQWLLQARQWREEVSFDLGERKGYINPRAFIRSLSAALPDDAVIVSDVGQNQIWTANHCNVRPGGRFFTTGGMGTMGYAIPAAVGAKFADPGRMVVAVCGDGAFQMQMMELATVCQENLNLKIILMKNGQLGMIRELQKKQYKGNYMAVGLDGGPDYGKIAGAYGIRAAGIREQSQAGEAIEEMLSHDGPYLLQCLVRPDEPSL
ncbi:biosynthetic-type acetolactate synthase large subunit [Zongyangia hominis]|uniref:Acetolactate synthase n=1 Tax=Zongyangia hominis TaxID=2763677 RepID=A0A926E9Q7_9FIRM|nr:biosynthetic-type acetolactate synthase large subunit [Zongyangia hominis]MBC8570515.1 biosynthetic-type acetolactate synthase large subunit [Zongyangia hominis]